MGRDGFRRPIAAGAARRIAVGDRGYLAPDAAGVGLRSRHQLEHDVEVAVPEALVPNQVFCRIERDDRGTRGEREGAAGTQRVHIVDSGTIFIHPVLAVGFEEHPDRRDVGFVEAAGRRKAEAHGGKCPVRPRDPNRSLGGELEIGHRDEGRPGFSAPQWTREPLMSELLPPSLNSPSRPPRHPGAGSPSGRRTAGVAWYSWP